MPNMPNPYQTRPQQQYGPRPMNNQFFTQQQYAMNHQPYDAFQRRPPGAIVQPRTLFDPNLGSTSRRVGGPHPSTQGVNIQTQINYIDQIARLKIPEVQMSTAECDEKQILKERLNEICRKVVCAHELEYNSEFPVQSVELKSFGSLSIGFATKDSDMDLVLVSPESKPSLSSPESKIPAKIEEVLQELGYGARLLTKTRVPIIKFCEKPGTELAAHLRLTRFCWDRDREEGVSQAERGSSEINPENVGELPLSPDRQDQDLEKNGSVPETSLLSEPAKPASQASETVLPSANEKEEKKDSRVDSKFDPAWLSRMSDHEATGLFQIVLREGRGTQHQRSIISECLGNLLAPTNPSPPASYQEALNTIPMILQNFRPPSREDLDYPKSGVGTQCDINFSNELALHNSLLLKCYALCDPRVREMVLFVKAWTKIRMINSPYHGTLSSYGYVLMVLHFLMNVAKPPIIPNLQLAKDMIEQDTLSSREATFDGHNVQFFRNEAALEEMARNGVFGQNKESLGSLLRNFFQFYANPPFNDFSWKDDVLSLRTRGGILKKVGKGWTGAKIEIVDTAGPSQKKVNHHYVVAIEDPFETNHNVARTVVFNGVVAIRNEFRRAADLIAFGGYDPRQGPQDFFAEGEKKEHLQRRFDGPPKNVAQKKAAPSSSGAAQKPAQKPSTNQTPNKEAPVQKNEEFTVRVGGLRVEVIPADGQADKAVLTE